MELREPWNAQLRSQDYNPVERFPEKIDQVLEAFDRVKTFFFIDNCIDYYLEFRSI